MILEIEKLNLSDKTKQDAVLQIVDQLLLDDTLCQRIRATFTSEIEAALNEQPSSLQCENTYIPELPNGKESGDFMALDLGGTNFRILILEVKESKIVFEFFKFYHIEDDLRVSDGHALFDFLAECIFGFLHNEPEVTKFLKGKDLKLLPLGFTFSFPMKQHSLSSAELITWTKSFNCKDLVGQCPVQNLNDAIHRVWATKRQEEKNDLQVEVLVVLNDTTGTLVQAAAVDPKVKIGVILGTGTNGAYMENVDCVKHWEIKPLEGEKTVLIDVEWGAFGDNGVLDFIKTKYDREVDDNSLLKSSFTFEKYIAGKYLGEVVRCVMQDLINQGLLFHNAESDRVKFPSPGMFTTNYVSHIEDDSLKNTNNQVIEIMENFNYRYNIDFNMDDIKIIKYVISVVSLRSAKLVACCLSVLLERILSFYTSEDPIGIGFDGSLYKHHPRLKNWIEFYTHRLTHYSADDKHQDRQQKFYLTEVTDGSGKGAAMVAAIANRLKTTQPFVEKLCK